jgi:Permuted papain-like amidase enzyme, YaeF/YiiX, C92 family
MRHPVLLIAVLLFAASSMAGLDPSGFVYQDGDIIFQTSLSDQSVAIQRATRSPYSHCGIIFYRNGKPYVFEAASTVRFTPIEEWIASGSGGHFVVRRLKDAGALFSEKAVSKFRAAAMRFQGKSYDSTFEWSDDRIYCSELVWKAYERGLSIQIGKLQKMKDFNLSDPIVARKLKERYGTKIPMNEPVISPEEIYRSELLATVMKK